MQVSHLRSERELLSGVSHPGVVRLLGSFQVVRHPSVPGFPSVRCRIGSAGQRDTWRTCAETAALALACAVHILKCVVTGSLANQ